MPRTSQTHNIQGSSYMSPGDISALPPPDMTMVQKLIDDAIAKARISAHKDKKISKHFEGGTHHVSRPALRRSPSPIYNKESISTRFKDFVCAFLVTFSAVYFFVTGYSLYHKMEGSLIEL